MKRVLFDAGVLIDFFRGQKQAVELVLEYQDVAVLSSITVAELFAGVRNDQETDDVEKYVESVQVAPVSTDIAKLAGLYRKKYGKSHGVGIVDAIVAATAATCVAELKTQNVKHYPMVKGLASAYSKR